MNDRLFPPEPGQDEKNAAFEKAEEMIRAMIQGDRKKAMALLKEMEPKKDSSP